MCHYLIMGDHFVTDLEVEAVRSELVSGDQARGRCVLDHGLVSDVVRRETGARKHGKGWNKSKGMTTFSLMELTRRGRQGMQSTSYRQKSRKLVRPVYCTQSENRDKQELKIHDCNC